MIYPILSQPTTIRVTLVIRIGIIQIVEIGFPICERFQPVSDYGVRCAGYLEIEKLRFFYVVTVFVSNFKYLAKINPLVLLLMGVRYCLVFYESL